MLAGALLGLAMTLLLRRYSGINHDSVLYLGQALIRRMPEIYGKDLFFVHGGSQDHYTLFPFLISKALDVASAPAIFMWSTFSCLILFTAAGWYCLKALLPPNQRFWAWLGVVCLPSMYGMTRIFSYSESFFTPRPPTEILCLVGIGLLARERWHLAAACMALGALFHPLQVIATLLVVWPWAIMQDKRWAHAAWLAIPIILLALAGIVPFAGLLQRADATWLFVLRDNNPQLFLTEWSIPDYTVLLLDVLVLGYCWHVVKGKFGDWCAAALFGLVLGLGANLILVDGLDLVLPAAMQLWRVHWIAHWLAMAGIATLLCNDIKGRDFPRALLLALTALLAWSQSGWIWLVPALLYGAWSHVIAKGRSRIARPIAWAVGIAMVVMFASYAYSEFTIFRMAHDRLDLYALDRRLLVFPLAGLGLPLLGAHAWNLLPAHGQKLAVACILAPLLALGLFRWDVRSPENLAFERSAFHSDVFGVDIPKNAQVTWGYDMLTGPWLVLGRASFFSPQQLSGQVFNREMALDGRRRLNRMYPILEDFLGCTDRDRPLQEREHCRISDVAMRHACIPGPDIRPDYVVLPFKQPQHEAGKWSIKDPVEAEPAVTYWLYACKDVMEDLQQAATASQEGRPTDQNPH